MKADTFNWNDFLSKESYTEEELQEANVLSGSWVTCACGNLCDAIPRCPDGSPWDEKLFELGMKFDNDITMMLHTRNTQVVFERYKRYSIETLNSIEKRSGEILQIIEIKNRKLNENRTAEPIN